MKQIANATYCEANLRFPALIVEIWLATRDKCHRADPCWDIEISNRQKTACRLNKSAHFYLSIWEKLITDCS